MSVKYTLLIALVAMFSFANENTDPAVQESMRVNLVELQVTAVNWNQKYVPGLTAADFVVKENGKEQTIDSIEEIDVGLMPEAEARANRARIMFLLDYKNTPYASMYKVFKEMNQYIDQDYDERDQIGLAANTRFGVQVLVPFTNDPHVFKEGLAKARSDFRGANHQRNRNSEGMLDNTFGYNPFTRGAIENAQYQLSDSYYRSELAVINQFVNYLGAWSGRKDLVLISGLWKTPDISDTESNTDSDGVASIKDLQTTSIYNKVSINVIGLYPSSDRTLRANLDEGFNQTERTSLLATATGGSYLRGNAAMVSGLVDKTVDRNQRFYLIRYYSNNTGDKFRRVRVAAKGINLMARVSGGYFPKDREAEVDMVAGRTKITEDGSAQFKLSMNTGWMTWDRIGFRKRGAWYAVSQIAYDDNGQILAEQVKTGQLRVKKKDGAYPPVLLQKDLALDLPNHEIPARVETVVTDLTSGKKMTLKHNGGDVI